MGGIYSTSGPPKKIPPIIFVPVRKEIIDGKMCTILKMERATDYEPNPKKHTDIRSRRTSRRPRSI